MSNYVRITFRPHGAKRRRTTWAVKISEKGDTVTYLACDKYGETEKEMGENKAGDVIARKEVIVSTKTEVVERPAKMNLKYAELELLPV